MGRADRRGRESFDQRKGQPRRLTLELTESHLAADMTDAQQNLARLRELGVKVAIDDFGTGYRHCRSCRTSRSPS